MTARSYFPLLIAVLFWGLISPLATAFERQISCRVIGISDGDTLTCLQERTPLKVRLQYIDAPESEQPFGKRAKKALAALIFKQNVRLIVSGYDRYQRLLAVVFNEQGENVNLRLVEQGMAWAYYRTEPPYQTAQQTAQQAQLGLWQQPAPINPADWRASKRSDFTQNAFPRAVSAPNQLDCSQKRSCNQIGNYALAEHYFRQCGWQELDGNADGIPCNKLYRKAHRGQR